MMITMLVLVMLLTPTGHGDGGHMKSGDHMNESGMMNGMMDGGMMSAWMLLWGVLALTLTVLAVVATVWLVKHLQDSSSESLRVLEQRYAAGEIEREEFVQRRGDLAAKR